MALQVWLPLNGDLHNLGLMPMTFSTVTANWNAAGKIGQAFSTLNSNVIGTCPSLNGITTFSLTFWVFPKTNSSITTNWCNIIALGSKSADNSTSAEFRFESSYGNTYILSHHNNTGEPIGGGTTSLVSERDKWYHIAVVVNNETHTIRYYVNGVLLTASSFLKTHNGGHLDGTIKLANESTDPDCLLNDIRIYNHALRAKEVEEIAKGLVLHYPLNLGNPNLITENFYLLTPWEEAILSWLTYEGKYCMLVNPRIVYQNAINNNIFPELTFEENTLYTISFDTRDDYRTDGKNTAMRIGFHYTDGTELNYNLGGPKIWTHKVYTSEVNKTIEYIRGSYGNSGYTYIANLKIEKGTIVTPFSYNNSNIIYDSSGYNNNGTIISSLTTIAPSPQYDYATHFNGIDSGILIEDLLLSSIINGQITYSFWIKPYEENGKRSVYFGSYNGVTWSIEKTTKNLIRSYWDSSPDISCSGTTIIDNEWLHICITKSGTNDLKVYINGELKYSSTTAMPEKIFPTTYRIGRDIRSNDGTPYCGDMSDFRIYATALTAAQVKELYNTSMIIENNIIKPRDLE